MSFLPSPKSRIYSLMLAPFILFGCQSMGGHKQNEADELSAHHPKSKQILESMENQGRLVVIREVDHLG